MTHAFDDAPPAPTGRPRSVASAEWLYLMASAIMVLTTMLSWDAIVAVYGVGFVGITTAILAAAYIAPILLATRWRSRIALGIVVAITVLGSLSLCYQIAVGVMAMGLVGILNTVQVVLTIVAVVLLFRPAARAWFAGQPVTLEDVVE